MASLGTHEQFYNYLTGQGPAPGQDTTLTTAGGGGTGAGGQTAQGTAQPIDQGAPQAAPRAAPSGLTFAGEGPALERIRGGFGSETKRIGEETARISREFAEAAGPGRAYDTSGAQAALQAGSQAASTPQQIEQASGFVGAKYAGPTSLNQEQAARLEESLGRVKSLGGRIQTGAGLSGLLQESVPGLSPGQARSEAQSILQQGQFVPESQTYIEKAGGLEATLKNQRQIAEEYAKGRESQEAEIARRSMEYLQGELGAVRAPIEARVSEEEKKRLARENAYQGIVERGEIPGSDLLKDAEKYQTAGRAESAEADRIWNEIMGRYEDVKDIPLMTLGISGHGRQDKIVPEGFEGEITPEQMARIQARQAELEGFFSPAIAGRPEAAEYSEYRPLYLGPDENLLDTEVPTYTPQPKGAYFEFDPGTIPTIQNMASLDEVGRINAINRLLDPEVGELMRDDEPFRQGVIAGNLEKFLEDEISELEARRGGLDQASKDYLSQLKHARKKYKTAKKRLKWSPIARVVKSTGAQDKLAKIPGAEMPLDMALDIESMGTDYNPMAR